MLEAEAGEDLLGDDALDDGDLEEEVELLLRLLGEDAELELEPEAGDRDEDGRARPLDVRDEGLERLREVDMEARDEGGCLDNGALKGVGEREVAQDPLVGAELDDLDEGLGAERDGAEGVHDTLRLTGGAGGVDDDGEFVGATDRLTGEGLGACGDGIPGFAGRLGCEGEDDAGEVGGRAGVDVGHAVELADEDELRLAMGEDELDVLGVEGGEECDRGVAGHPDRELCDDEVSAVLGDHRDAGAGRVAERLKMGGHAAGLLGDL